jgi:hypothetical protein
MTKMAADRSLTPVAGNESGAYDGVFEYFSDGRPTWVVVENKYYDIAQMTPSILKLPTDTLMIDESQRMYKINPPSRLFNKAAVAERNNINDGIFSDMKGGKPTHAVICGKFYTLTPRPPMPH